MSKTKLLPRAIGKAGLVSGVLATILLASLPATAARLGVQVVDDSGTPIAGASVCVGLPGNYRQFGAMFTDETGTAFTEVPNVPLTITISKTRFSGIRINEPARDFNLVKQVTLVDGVPGPRCKAGSSLADDASGLITVENVAAYDNGGQTLIESDVKGQPTHYRVSTDPFFTNSNWTSFNPLIQLDSRLADAGSVYLQFRRFEGTDTASLEARSRVITVLLPALL